MLLIRMFDIQNSTHNEYIFLIEWRLAGGPDKYEGRVEVKYGGHWGTVCDDYFDMPDAEMICKKLGFE